MFHFFIEPPESCSITTAEHPGHSSPCATVNGFDDPNFSFFDPTKCHISSNSICWISPDTSGSGRFLPKAWIQRYIRVWSVFKIRPIILNEPFAMEYSKMHRAFFAATFSFVRLSPSRKLHPHSLHLYRCLPPNIPFLTARSHPHLLHIGIVSIPSVGDRNIILYIAIFVNTLVLLNWIVALLAQRIKRLYHHDSFYWSGQWNFLHTLCNLGVTLNRYVQLGRNIALYSYLM